MIKDKLRDGAPGSRKTDWARQPGGRKSKRKDPHGTARGAAKVEEAKIKKKRAIAYIAASRASRLAEIARIEAHRALQLELGASAGGLAPTDAANYVVQQTCVTRLGEVLEVLRSAP